MNRLWLKLLAVTAIFLVLIVGLQGFSRRSPSSPTTTEPQTRTETSPERSPGKTPPGRPLKFPLQAPAGFGVALFAEGLSKVRDLDFSPGGTLVASILDKGKVVALPDKNGDGMADEVKEIVSGLKNPHGLAFYPFRSTEGKLFVAEETKVSRYFWSEENLTARLDKVLFDLPAGGRHFTRSLAFDKEGRLFVSVGSTCDVCFEKDDRLAAVLVSDAEGREPRVFANGLRNSVFITVNPETNQLWGTEMGRDFLGDNLPPDEINIIREGKGYGWPVCFGQNVHDKDFDKKPFMEQVVGSLETVRCGHKVPPVFEIPAHSAPLGLAFISSPIFPKDWQGDLLVSYHGSWNSSVPVGYKVVRLNLEGEKVVSEEDFISGFLSGSETLGRPVDLVFDKEGRLFVSDDHAGNIYLVSLQRSVTE